MKTVKKGTVRSKIKKGDVVVFIAGKEYNRYDASGKRNPFRGQVIAVDPVAGKVKVEGAMLVKKHQRAVPQMNIKGGIVEKEAWVNISNVALTDPDTGKPTRVRYEIKDGKKVRVSTSGKVIGGKPVKAEKAEKASKAEKTEDTEKVAKAPKAEKAEKETKPKKASKKKTEE